VFAVTHTSIRGWLPGRKALTIRFNLPRQLPKGRYKLALGVVDPRTKRPAVQLAVEGRDKYGWYPLGTLEID
jgi:hypothetical protein